MQIVETTPEGWAQAIAELEQKHASAMTQVEQPRAQKQELALDAGLGSEDAGKCLTKINGDLNKISLEIDDLNTALASARDQQKAAEKTASAEAELARQKQIGEALEQFYATAKEIDDSLRILASRCAAARQQLDRAES